MELTVLAEGRHPKLVEGKVHEVIRYRFGVRAKPEGAAE